MPFNPFTTFRTKMKEKKARRPFVSKAAKALNPLFGCASESSEQIKTKTYCLKTFQGGDPAHTRY